MAGDYKLYNFMDMNFLDTINADNWENMFDAYMTVEKEDDGTLEYVFTPDVMKRFIQTLLTQKDAERADWLRSEIERLNWMLKELDGEPLDDWNEDISWNQAIVSIITRYKEELEALQDKK